MLLRNLVILVLILSLLSALLSGGVAWLGQNSLSQLEEKRQPVLTLIQSVTMIRNIQFDYLISHEQRSLRQWHILYNKSKNLSEMLQYDNPVTELRIKRIKKSLNSLYKLFESSHSIYLDDQKKTSSYEEEKFMLVYTLLNQQSMNILDEASLIEQDISERVLIIRDQLSLVMILTFTIFPLITILSILILYRRIDISLSRIEKGTQIIGSGDLNYRISISGNDEFVNFSRSFNKMIENLQEVLISRELLKIEKEMAEEANRSKSIFLANMSHELRSPLNVILGFSHLVKNDSSLPRDQKRRIEIIHSSGEHLLTIINDLLDMAKIESGIIEKDIHPFDLRQLIERTFEMYSLLAAQKGLIYTLDLLPDLPGYVLSDEKKIRQVLINLISNAVKFTSSGEVTVRVFSNPDEGEESPLHAPEYHNSVTLTFVIQDTGSGISPDEIEKIFLPFEQSESGKFRPDGTGLGLPISRAYAELLGGTLTVVSQGKPGNGSIFTFNLVSVPVISSVSPEQLRSESGKMVINGKTDYTILIVDDLQEPRELLAAFHSHAGIETIQVSCGEEAVLWCRSKRPDLIWMDIIMPGMKGDEAMRLIKKESVDPPIFIAVTANAFESEKQHYLRMGFDGYLAKPYTEKDVLEILEPFLSSSFAMIAEHGRSPGRDGDTDNNGFTISSFDDSLRVQLVEATEQRNITRLYRILQQVRCENPLFADILEEKLLEFDFEQIIALLNSEP